MFNRIALLGLLAVVAAFLAGPAAAQDDLIVGAWRQVQSNAGACRTCRISFARQGASLNVTANNGWSARVRVGAAKDTVAASGTGAWAPGKSGTTAGRPFTVEFRLIDQRLHMSMRILKADGSERRVEGVFERAWVGV
jgi:hypothetical protein